MTRPAVLERDRWERRLAELAAQHRVVGATLGIRTLAGDESAQTVTTATGVLNLRTGAAVEEHSLFEIGSITKVWTAVLIMQLVDEGRLALDAPVREVLPGLRLADEEAAAAITARQLLCHSSGIDGDLFVDCGRGDDAVARFVDQLADAALIHPVAGGFSYCNSGFVVLGRIIEVLRGTTWDQAVRAHLIDPLGLRRTVTLPEQAILHSIAVGHDPDDDGRILPANAWGISRCMGPAGSIVSCVEDLLVFATAMARDGLAENGRRIVSSAGARAMRQQNIDLAGRESRYSGWGLGWFLQRWESEDVYGHDGGTIGQRAFLRILPDSGLLVALLTNTGPRGIALCDQLFLELAAEFGTAPRPPLQPLDAEAGGFVERERHVGTYETAAQRITVRPDGDRLVMNLIEKLSLDPTAEFGDARSLPLSPVAPGYFAARETADDPWSDVVFGESTTGPWISYAHRIYPKRG